MSYDGKYTQISVTLTILHSEFCRPPRAVETVVLCVPDDPVAGLIDDESCGDPRLRVGGDCQLSDIKDDLYNLFFISFFFFTNSSFLLRSFEAKTKGKQNQL